MKSYVHSIASLLFNLAFYFWRVYLGFKIHKIVKILMMKKMCTYQTVVGHWGYDNILSREPGWF